MRIHILQLFGLLIAPAVLPCLAQQDQSNACTPEGTWYGGSVVAYFMTIVPAGADGQFTATAQPMYKNAVMSTGYSGSMKQNGNVYEGPTMSLTTQDPAYSGPPPFPNLPDLAVGWMSLEMLDCNTIRNTLPFFGQYLGASIWKPGTPWTGIEWLPNPKIPLVSPPDVDLIPILTGDTRPIVETYRRLPRSVNPALLHK